MKQNPKNLSAKRGRLSPAGNGKFSKLPCCPGQDYIGTLAAVFTEIGDISAALKWQKKLHLLLANQSPEHIRMQYNVHL